MQIYRKVVGIGAALIICLVMQTKVQAQEVLSMDEFVRLATANDTRFEEILIDELPLRYQKDLRLPAKDLILAVKAQYDAFLDQNRDEAETSLSLSKLFPYTGTDLSLGYENTPSASSTTSSSEFSFTLTQPIAENAFGAVTRLKDKIIGLENEVAKFQIIEAYEDYLAAIITAYMDWYGSYESLKISKSSYQQNLKLMDNIKERQKSSIALPLDVNKIKLQVMAKQETLIELNEEYQNALNVVLTAIRADPSKELIPQRPVLYDRVQPNFEEDFQSFQTQGRTFAILKQLEEKTSLEVDQNANELLPSIDLLFGYEVDGDDYAIKNEDQFLYAGVSLSWPIGDQVQKAELDVAKAQLAKRKLTTVSTEFRLYTGIKNLTLQIEREKQLSKIAEEKISIAQEILDDESENYSFGKVTINDYIDAVNVVDNNKFNHIRREVTYKKLLVEWLRITDRLVQKSDEELF